MWCHPAAFLLGKRDVIGAWLICLALVMAFFGYPGRHDRAGCLGGRPLYRDRWSQACVLTGEQPVGCVATAWNKAAKPRSNDLIRSKGVRREAVSALGVPLLRAARWTIGRGADCPSEQAVKSKRIAQTEEIGWRSVG